MASPDGYLVVDKPAGLTSHDVVARARRLLGERRVGHGGTLDPGATGVLVLAVGRATRLLRFVSELPKRYVGEIVLGTATSSLDADGEVVARYEMSGVGLEEARRAASLLTGAIEQVPPMVSAVKVGGKRLHQLAREGLEVERAPRPVVVHSFELEESAERGVLLASVECSSGTYVRSLAADLGTALGGGAHLRNLRRLAVGPFRLADAVALEDIAPDRVLPPAGLVAHLDAVSMPEDRLGELVHGAVLDAGELGASGTGPFALLDRAGSLLAVYEPAASGRIKPVVVLAEATRPRPFSVVTVGNFDGVHLGHRHLLRAARRLADEKGLPLVVVTFDRHPLATLSPERVPPLLTTTAHKVELLRAAGAEEVVVLDFDRRLADQSAEDFVRKVLLGRLGAAAVVVGANFHFGHRALGNVALLEHLAAEAGFIAEGIALHDEHGAAVSSTRIRSLVAAGDLDEAAALLGRPYELRGRRAGEPSTIEVADGLALPPAGRYAVELSRLGRALRPALVELSRPAAGREVTLRLLEPDSRATELAPGSYRVVFGTPFAPGEAGSSRAQCSFEAGR